MLPMLGKPAMQSDITVNLFTFVISSLFYGFTFANVVGWRKKLQEIDVCQFIPSEIFLPTMESSFFGIYLFICSLYKVFLYL